MPRGLAPRQPARTGRQDKVRRVATDATSRGKSRRRKRLRSARESRSAAAAAPAAKIKGYNPVAPERVAEILKRLDQLYPDVTCALTHASAWELVVATILSAQSTDVNVNRVTPELFRKYPTVAAFAALTPEQLEPDVRSTGFFRNKSKSVVGAAKKIVADFGGQVPERHGEAAHPARRRAQDRERGAGDRGSRRRSASSSIRMCTASRGVWN